LIANPDPAWICEEDITIINAKLYCDIIEKRTVTIKYLGTILRKKINELYKSRTDTERSLTCMHIEDIISKIELLISKNADDAQCVEHTITTADILVENGADMALKNRIQEDFRYFA
jgi:hypothetical protein